jgi:Uma2 family endonuclease
MVRFTRKAGCLMTITNEKRTNEDPPVAMPADWVPGPRQGFWTYAAYAALPDDGKRYESVQGVLMMSPAPEPAHQGVEGKIYRYLCSQVFDTKRGLVLHAPTDVVLSEHTTVQPDVLVLLKEHLDRLQKKRIVGAPDLAVEVISPGSAAYDRFAKYAVYEQAGVPEYWLVNSRMQTIEVFTLEEGAYHSLGLFRDEQCLTSQIVPDITVAVNWFFDWAYGLL